MSCGRSLFGPSSQYIKLNNGDFIAIEGSNTIERQILSDLRIPYRQVLKARVILKPGQVSYFLNYFSLGDNVTFLSIKALYDPKSVIEDDNYVTWNYYDDLSSLHSMAQLLVLTGNSTNRVPQLYLTNPNANYHVYLDVMVAIIDDQYSFFNDSVNQTGTSFTGLNYTDIKTHVVGESIVIYDKNSPPRPLIYIALSNILSIERNGVILTIDDSNHGNILLQFLTSFDANQAQSLLNYILENPNTDINTLSPVDDLVDPVIYFYSRIAGSASGNYISFNGSTSSVPYNTGFGYTFSTSISMGLFGTASGTIIDKTQLVYLLVDHVSDNRDGAMELMDSNLVINGPTGSVTSILNTGTYSLSFNFSDIAQNYLDGVIVNLNIQS